MNIRSALRSIAYELGKAGSYSNDKVIAEMRSRYPNLLASEAEKLQSVALKKILSDVDARQIKIVNPDQQEFFPELAGMPGSCDARSLGLAEEKGTRIPLHLLPIRAVRVLVTNQRPRNNKLSFKSQLQEHLDKLSPHIVSEDETIGSVLKRCRE
jgi:hypothetical protein